MENPLLRSLMEFYREEDTLLAQNSTQHFKQMLSTLMIDICLTSGCFQSVEGGGVQHMIPTTYMHIHEHNFVSGDIEEYLTLD